MFENEEQILCYNELNQLERIQKLKRKKNLYDNRMRK